MHSQNKNINEWVNILCIAYTQQMLVNIMNPYIISEETETRGDQTIFKVTQLVDDAAKI